MKQKTLDNKEIDADKYENMTSFDRACRKERIKRYMKQEKHK